MAFIQVAQLSKAYRAGRETIQVLRELSLEVEQGEMVAIVGASSPVRRGLEEGGGKPAT